jgi:hypothetical protein
MNRLAATLVAMLTLFTASAAHANHEPTQTNDNGEAALLLSSTSTTTTAVVGGIILTVLMASDAESMEDYLEDNAVALQTDLRLGAGETVDDLALAFGVPEARRSDFGRVIRARRHELLELADPARLDRGRATRFIEVVLAAAASEGIVDIATLTPT